MNIENEYVISNITKNINLYLEENVIHEIIVFYDYWEKININNKKDNYYSTGPDYFFVDIGKKTIYKMKEHTDSIYNVKFVCKTNIIKETNISFSFECIYINFEKKLTIIKNMIHIFQYNEENCILKIMPLCNITSKSIYVNIKKKEIEHITNKLTQLRLKIKCCYYPKYGKNKGVRCEDETNNETMYTDTPLCNKHKRFVNIL